MYRLISFLIILYCSSASFAHTDSLYNLSIKDTLIIEGCEEYAPFDFKDKNGNYVGFDVEIMDALMKRMNMPYKYSQSGADVIFGRSNPSEVDLVSGITFSPKHRLDFSFGIPLVYIWKKIVSTNNRPIDCIDSLKGKTVLMRVRQWNDAKESPILSKVKKVIIEPDWDTAFSLLQKGEVDAMIVGSYPVEYAVKERNIKNLHYADFSSKPIMQSFAVPSGKEELLFRLNEKLQILKQDGTYDEIYNKWFGVYENNQYKNAIEIALSIFVLLTLLCLGYAIKYYSTILRHRAEIRIALKAGKITTFHYRPGSETFYLLNVNDGKKERKISMKVLINQLIEKDGIALQQAIQTVLDKNEDVSIRVRYKDDVLKVGGHTLRVNLTKHKRKDLKAAYIIGAYKDVTKQVSTEEKLEEEKKHAEKANKMKSLFLANMSHDIRTPLNAIVGASEILTMDDNSLSLTDDDRKVMLDMIKTNVATATTLVSDLLDITKIESGAYKISISSIQLNKLCIVVIDSVKPRLKDGVEIKFAPQENDEYRLNTDPVRLQQVLTNYMTNACKYTKKGQIELGYHTESNRIVFTVTDTGVGVPLEKAEKCFEMFNMLDSQVEGHGLGLYICRITSQLMQGKVYVDTSYTAGARFVFEHPLILQKAD